MVERSEAPIAAVLRNNRRVLIRPLEEGDRSALLAFGRGLPEDDWLYLEDDVRSPDIIGRLVNAAAAENWRQLVAVAEDRSIVGYSAVRRLPGWSNHVADIQLIISDSHRRCSLGTLLAEATFDAARELGVAKVIVEILEEQTGGQAIFERLGFHREGTFNNHAYDRYGQQHNMVVLAYHVL